MPSFCCRDLAARNCLVSWRLYQSITDSENWGLWTVKRTSISVTMGRGKAILPVQLDGSRKFDGWNLTTQSDVWWAYKAQGKCGQHRQIWEPEGTLKVSLFSYMREHKTIEVEWFSSKLKWKLEGKKGLFLGLSSLYQFFWSFSLLNCMFKRSIYFSYLITLQKCRGYD